MEKQQIQRKKILFLNNFLFGSYLLQTISFMGLTKDPIFNSLQDLFQKLELLLDRKSELWKTI